MWANIYRGFGYAGYQPGDKYLTIAGGSLLPKKLKFGRSLYFWLQNSMVVPSYYLDKDYSQELAGLIRNKKPEYIYGYSSSIYQFSRYLQESNTRIDGLKAIFTTADMLYPQKRKAIEEVLGAPVFDNYGCPEAGVMTWECEHHDGYHYNMESCFLEILDRDSSGTGRIISTNLTNYAFPIVRYDTDDIAALEHTGVCACGRSHSKIKSLIGRQRDIITLPGGNMIHGAFFNHFPAFYDNDLISRYQIVQTEPEEIEVHIEPVPGCKLEELSYVGDELRKALGNEVKISLIEGGFRESSFSRKHRVVISDVDNKWTLDRSN
jgi:phenylacetate-CoA ligase